MGRGPNEWVAHIRQAKELVIVADVTVALPDEGDVFAEGSRPGGGAKGGSRGKKAAKGAKKAAKGAKKATRGAGAKKKVVKKAPKKAAPKKAGTKATAKAGGKKRVIKRK